MRCDSEFLVATPSRPSRNVAVPTISTTSSPRSSSPKNALTSIVKEIRRERAQQVRRAAAKAQPKVALIATTTMVPGAMILMLGGMVFANRDTFAKLFGG